MQRVILHADLNNCYASIECLLRPELKGLPVAVGASAEKRHGIILAKNQLAKAKGVKTGETLWQAKAKCPDLVVLPPNFPLYVRFCQAAQALYAQYTDQVEPFGLDECWLDVSASLGLWGSGKAIADELRRRIRQELGLTISVGVADNKIFAKLGSDMKKPDATTVIDQENFRVKVWGLPVEALLGVGPANQEKLRRHGIFTIGQLANATPAFLDFVIGSKQGRLLRTFANGEDTSPVQRLGELPMVKSVGNSTTTPRDLVTEEEVRMVMTLLAESVSSRLRKKGLYAQGVQIQLRESSLVVYERQGRLSAPSHLAKELLSLGMELFHAACPHRIPPLRSLGLRAIDVTEKEGDFQLDLFCPLAKREKEERLENAMEDIRRRFGYGSVRRASLLKAESLHLLETDGPFPPVGFAKEIQE